MVWLQQTDARRMPRRRIRGAGAMEKDDNGADVYSKRFAYPAWKNGFVASDLGAGPACIKACTPGCLHSGARLGSEACVHSA